MIRPHPPSVPPTSLSPVPIALRRPTALPPPADVLDRQPGGQHQFGPSQTKNPLRCIQCRHPISDDFARIAISGSHRHVFANPHGIVFDVGCFAVAPGCVIGGEPTQDFSWFPGTSWQVALCAVCGLHMGWRYTTTDGQRFFGLILDRLISLPEDSL